MIKTFSIHPAICGAFNVVNIDCMMKDPNCLSPVAPRHRRENEYTTFLKAKRGPCCLAEGEYLFSPSGLCILIMPRSIINIMPVEHRLFLDTDSELSIHG